MERGEVLQRLEGLPLLQYMPDALRTRVAQMLTEISREISLEKGEILIRHGEIGGETGYVLVDGEAEVDRGDDCPIGVPAPALLGEMYQFNPQAQRTATVRTRTPVRALRFTWPSFYSTAKASFTPAEQSSIVDAMERCILQRFDRAMLLDLALFRGLDDDLKLRVCLLLQWVTQVLIFRDGEILFQQNGMCGGEGWLLTHGQVELRKAGQLFDTRRAPDLLGVLPEFNPDLRWTTSAVARGPVEVLKFSWLEFNALFEQRSTPDLRARFRDAVRNNASFHFVH